MSFRERLGGRSAPATQQEILPELMGIGFVFPVRDIQEVHYYLILKIYRIHRLNNSGHTTAERFPGSQIQLHNAVEPPLR